jgi:hypothetical protein
MKKLAVISATLLFAAVAYKVDAKVLDNGAGDRINKGDQLEEGSGRITESDIIGEQYENQLSADFGVSSDVQWDKFQNYDAATFEKDGHMITACYDNDAELIGTIYAKKFTDLPERGQKKIKTKYAGYSVEQVIYYIDDQSNALDLLAYSTPYHEGKNYFVSLKKGQEKVVLRVDPQGYVYDYASR